MSSKCKSFLNTAIGLAFAGCGAMKLLDADCCSRHFSRWGWRKKDMQIMGASEVAGAALLLTPKTRRLGALILAAASACLLITAVRRNDGKVAATQSVAFAAAFLSLMCKGKSCR